MTKTIRQTKPKGVTSQMKASAVDEYIPMVLFVSLLEGSHFLAIFNLMLRAGKCSGENVNNKNIAVISSHTIFLPASF